MCLSRCRIIKHAWLNIFVELYVVYQHTEELMSWNCDDTEDVQEFRTVNTLMMMCRTEDAFQSSTRGRLSVICDHMNACVKV